MGEMTIRGIDNVLLEELKLQARRQGIAPDAYAADLLRQSLALRRGTRGAVAREIRAKQLKKAETESVVFIREDRDAR